MRKIVDTGCCSYCVGEISKGCKFCVKGEKLVLFITGLCSRKCYYCPLSDIKKDKDDVWANEWKIDSVKDIIEEARLCDSKGAGITGGDPFLRFDRTLGIIKLLKKEFGSNFHIHLYAPLLLVTKEKLDKLYKAGLDEIRFHPDLEDNKSLDWINLAAGFGWDVGVEIPVIPGLKKQTIELIDFIQDKINFLNLNELELSDTNSCKLEEKGFVAKDDMSYGVSGSEELAIELMDYCSKKTKLNVHYCTAKLKDKVQLRNRIMRRAKNVAKEFDKITKDGMLLRGAIYLKEFKPGFGYRKKCEETGKKLAGKLNTALNKLKKKIDEEIILDVNKARLICSERVVRDNKELILKLGLVPAVVEEYPTYDATEVEIEFL